MKSLSKKQAQDITGQIRSTAENLWELIEQAYHGRAWKVLGYYSWDDYCASEFNTRLKLPREERKTIVASLRDSGMSQRAIASAIGTGKRQVQEALAELGSESPPETPGGDASSQISVSKTITGTDGKTYKATKLDKEIKNAIEAEKIRDAAKAAGATEVDEEEPEYDVTEGEIVIQSLKDSAEQTETLQIVLDSIMEVRGIVDVVIAQVYSLHQQKDRNLVSQIITELSSLYIDLETQYSSQLEGECNV